MTARDWDAAVSRADVDRILRFVFGKRGAVPLVASLPGGSINSVYRVDLDESVSCILRIAPSEEAAQRGPGWFTPYGLRRELAVIDAAVTLRDYLPEKLAHDFDGAVLDRDWVIQQVMPGVSLASIDDNLDPVARSAIWNDLGDFTRRLHAITSDRFGPPAWGLAFTLWSDQVRWDVASLIDDAARYGYPAAPFERLARLAEHMALLLDEVTTPALIHSDLSRTHVFVKPAVDGEARLAGVIDLEFGRYADPLSEHLITGFEWGNAPIAMRPAFMHGYGRSAFTRDEEIRIRLYVALSMAWLVPLLAFQGQPYDDVMADFERALAAIEAG